MEMKNNNFLTVAEAAEMLGTKEATIRVYISVGKLSSKLVKGRRMIAVEELQRYIREKEKFLKKGGFTKKKCLSY